MPREFTTKVRFYPFFPRNQNQPPEIRRLPNGGEGGREQSWSFPTPEELSERNQLPWSVGIKKTRFIPTIFLDFVSLHKPTTTTAANMPWPAERLPRFGLGLPAAAYGRPPPSICSLIALTSFAAPERERERERRLRRRQTINTAAATAARCGQQT